MAQTITGAPPVDGQRLRMTYEEWRDWYDGEGRRGEWVNGEVIVFAMPKVIHQRVLFFFATLLASHVRRFKLGEVFIAGTEMWLSEPPAARLPDIFFLAQDHRDRLNADRLDGPADLAVEIVSEDSVTRDRRDKLLEYQRVGVPEYWILDPRPRQQHTRFYQLYANGLYREVGLDERGRYHSSAVHGFWLEPGWLWQDPLPDPDVIAHRIRRGR